MYTLFKEQDVHTTLDEAWNFLKNPSNLNLITPDDLDFDIITDVPAEIYNGLLIEYRIKIPFTGVHTWVAEIKHICEYGFVDEQRVGPYKFWYHYHELIEQDDKVKIIDKVYYELPFGLAGKTILGIFIKNTLERIFKYRQQKIEEYLNH